MIDDALFAAAAAGPPTRTRTGPPTWLDVYLVFCEAFAGFRYDVRLFTRPGPRGEIELHLISDVAEQLRRKLGLPENEHPWRGVVVVPVDGEPTPLEDPVPHRGTIIIDNPLEMALNSRRQMDAKMREVAVAVVESFGRYLDGEIDENYRRVLTEGWPEQNTLEPWLR